MTVVRVVCDANAHDELELRRWMVDDGGRVWRLGNQGERATRLHGDKPVTSSAEAMEHEKAGGEWRHKVKLTCPQCGDRLEVRTERLDPVIEVLARHGVPSISLAGIRGRLSGK